MAQSDIEIAGLAKVGETDAKYLVSLIRSIPGFPIPYNVCTYSRMF